MKSAEDMKYGVKKEISERLNVFHRSQPIDQTKERGTKFTNGVGVYGQNACHGDIKMVLHRDDGGE